MESRTIMAVALGAVIIIGGYFVFMKPKQQTTETPGTTQEQTTTQPSGKKMAFSEFMKQGGAYECTVNQSVEGTETKGTVFMDNGMVRGAFNTKVQGMSVDSNFIVKDGYTYTWTSALANMGFKTKVSATAGTAGGATASGQYSFDGSQIGDYDCKAWSADSSKFAVPANITFKAL